MGVYIPWERLVESAALSRGSNHKQGAYTTVIQHLALLATDKGLGYIDIILAITDVLV